MSAEEGGRRTLRYLGEGGRGLWRGRRHPHRSHSLDRESPGKGRESRVGRHVSPDGGTKKMTTGIRRGRHESRSYQTGHDHSWCAGVGVEERWLLLVPSTFPPVSLPWCEAKLLEDGGKTVFGSSGDGLLESADSDDSTVLVGSRGA